MNKSAELAHLRKLAAELGPNSYIGPWLLENIPAIERDIMSDFHPLVSWQESVKAASENAQAIIEQAHRDAARIIADAEQTAKNARAERDDVLRYGYSCLESAIKRLEGYTHA